MPDQLMPDHDIPDQLMPDQVMPDQVIPDHDIPDQFAPVLSPAAQLRASKRTTADVDLTADGHGRRR